MLYLDHAATSWPKDARVVEAVARALVDPGVAPDRGSSARARSAARIVAVARERTARLLAVSTPERVTFTLNATDALNLAIKGCLLDGRLAAGDAVVLSAVEHNSVVRPLQGLAARHGLRLVVAPADRFGVVDADQVLKRVTPRTKLVVLAHASNVTGALQPVAAVGHGLAGRAPRPLFLVDVAQTAGYRPLDEVADIADLIAGAGHKGPGGPLGTGFLWVRPGIELVALREGGTGTHSEEPTQPREDPGALEAGSPNVPGIAGLSAALRIRLEETTLTGVAAARREGTREFLERGAGVPGLELFGPCVAAAREPVFALRVRGLSVAEAAVLLETEFGLEQRAGLHCAPGAHQALGTFPEGTLRVSFGAAPTPVEVTTALAALAELAHAGARRTT